MPLPTTLTGFTAADHASYHNSLDTMMPWLDLPTVSTATTSGHLAHHGILHDYHRAGLPVTVTAGMTGHVAHHNTLHAHHNRLESPEGPLTVSTGQTISNRVFRRTDATANTGAITISTASPVVIERCIILHNSVGIRSFPNQAKLTVRDCYIIKDQSSVVEDGRAVKMADGSELTVENCVLVDGGGILWNADNSSPDPALGRIRYNRSFNVGRYLPTALVQFFQANHVILPGLEVAWNHATNPFGKSRVEDTINISDTQGSSGSPVEIHHNLLDGAYPTTLGGGYAGGGALMESGSTFVRIHDNTAIGTTNYGFAIAGSHDNRVYNNRAVSDGRNEAGDFVTASNVGVYVWNIGSDPLWANNWADGNTIGWVNTSGGGRNDTFLPDCNPSGNCTNNTALANPIDATDEQAERDLWEAARAAASVTIGVRP